MVLDNKNIYAFDECSVLKLCIIKIPDAYSGYFEQNVLLQRNHDKVKKLISALGKANIPRYKFMSASLENNMVEAVNQLFEEIGYNGILGRAFKGDILEQIEASRNQLENEFINIEKIDNISDIKEIFTQNERELNKEKNIPEDDDMMIIAGYKVFSSIGKKFLISEDEHFWGYQDIILSNFDINVIKEKECLVLMN